MSIRSAFDELRSVVGGCRQADPALAASIISDVSAWIPLSVEGQEFLSSTCADESGISWFVEELTI